MSDKWTLIAESGGRELYRWEKQTPDGDWEIFFRGKEYLTLPNGAVKQTPSDPFFKTEANGRGWLSEK